MYKDRPLYEKQSDSILKAGPEIGVCSTKAFTSQVMVLALFALMMARMRNISKGEVSDSFEHLLRWPPGCRQS